MLADVKDGGVDFQLDITDDAIRGGRLINNKDYYYAVTAYAYDVLNVVPYVAGSDSIGIVSEILESARTPIRISPGTSSAVLSTSATAVSAGETNLFGDVTIQQLIQNQITGNSYRITFDDQERWTLVNVTTGDTLLADQTNISGGADNPIVEGFMPRVTAPRGVATFGELLPDSSLHDMTDNQPDTTGTWHFRSDAVGGDISLYVFGGATTDDYEIRFLGRAMWHSRRSTRSRSRSGTWGPTRSTTIPTTSRSPSRRAIGT